MTAPTTPKKPEALGVDTLGIHQRATEAHKETDTEFENRRLKALELDERQRGMRPARAGTPRLTRAMDSPVKKDAPPLVKKPIAPPVRK